MPIAREGLREIMLATLVLGGGAAAGFFFWWPLAIPFLALWVFVIAFFRDPNRRRVHTAGALCSPADGTVTEITELPSSSMLERPGVRIGIFLSIFNVHINRAPCAGVVRSTSYRRGEYLDARHEESGARNESNTLVIDPESPIPGPIVVRQVAGWVARRIICHASAGTRLGMGERFGMIKFGSRTELVIPRLPGTEIKVKVGDRVRAGLTVLASQAVGRTASEKAMKYDEHAQEGPSVAAPQRLAESTGVKQ